MPRPSTLAAAIVVAGTLVTMLASPGSADIDAESAVVDVVRIPFDVGVRGQPMPADIPNLGDPDVVATKVVKNGGEIVVASGRPGNGRAADLPPFDGAEAGPRAVVQVVDTDLADGDGLSPGLKRFTFGADFRLDEVSTGSTYDDGNNLIQRGLAGSSDQYKIQVDSTALGFRPSCALAQVTETETRSAFVTSTVVVESDTWYRVRCTRTRTVLTIVVTPYAADGSAETPVSTPEPGIPRINLTWPTTVPVVPMSIGGKLNPTGVIATQSDQFNGVVDNAVLTIG